MDFETLKHIIEVIFKTDLWKPNLKLFSLLVYHTETPWRCSLEIDALDISTGEDLCGENVIMLSDFPLPVDWVYGNGSGIGRFWCMQSRYKIVGHSKQLNPVSTSTWLSSRWGLEYVDYIPCIGVRHLSKEFSGYDTKRCQMKRLQFWRTEECEVPLHYHYSPIHSQRRSSTC